MLLIVPAQADSSASTGTLPDLGRPADRSANFSAGPGGATLTDTVDGKRFVLSPEYSQQTGISLGGAFAFPLGDSAAGGLVATLGGRKQELLINVGVQFDPVRRLILSAGQLRQDLEFAFVSGKERAAMTQNSGAVSYQRFLGHGLLNAVEFNGYVADTPSRDLADKTYAVDTAALYELWNDPRRVAGGRVTGAQGRLAFTPLANATLRLGLGGERLEYDYFTGKQSMARGTASADWSQRLDTGFTLRAGLDAAAAQNRFSFGVDRALGEGWRFGVQAVAIRGRDGAPNDNQLKLTWTYDLGGKRGSAAPVLGGATIANRVAPEPSPSRPGNADPAWGDLLDQVARRPSSIPAQVVAKLDTTAAPTRLVAIDKAALPAGSTIASGAIITVPLGVAVTTIAGVTVNGGAFTSGGQFALSGNNLLVDPNKIAQPAVGVTDTYVVTINNAGGGTTLVTILVSRGSVKIDSITIASGPTAPTASAVGITGTATVGQTLTGRYTYADANGDPQGTSTFRWLRNGVAIAGATAITYTLVADDYGKAISFEVTPIATVAPTTGTPVASSATTVLLPAGYVAQGGLTWMPNNVVPPDGTDSWPNANAYCTTATILGQTGWRLPTTAELGALFTSRAFAGQGWALENTWSSTSQGVGVHENVALLNGTVNSNPDAFIRNFSCVRQP